MIVRRHVLALSATALLVHTTRAAAQAPGPIELLIFEEPGCPWCARWRQEIGPAYPKSVEGRRAPVRHIMIHEQHRAGVTLTLPITVSPTFVLSDGTKEVGRISGYPGQDFFWGMLAELIAKLDRPAPPKS